MLFALTSQDRLIRELYRFICMFLTDTSLAVVLIPAGLARTRISFLLYIIWPYLAQSILMWETICWRKATNNSFWHESPIIHRLFC